MSNLFLSCNIACQRSFAISAGSYACARVQEYRPACVFCQKEKSLHLLYLLYNTKAMGKIFAKGDGFLFDVKPHWLLPGSNLWSSGLFK